MGMFQGDLAFTVELIAIAVGFYFFHLAKKENSKEIKIGAYILVIGGILTALCTGFYLTKFWWSGAYSYTSHGGMHRSGHTMKGKTTARHNMMDIKDCHKLKNHMDSCNADGNCFHNDKMMNYCSEKHNVDMSK